MYSPFHILHDCVEKEILFDPPPFRYLLFDILHNYVWKYLILGPPPQGAETKKTVLYMYV